MKPEAELAAGGDITVQDGLPSKPGHNNIPVKEESSAAAANCSPLPDTAPGQLT